MPAPQHLIFDLDGTLIDSAPSLLASFGAALDQHGVPAVRPLTRDIIGPPLFEILEKLTGIAERSVLEPLAIAFKAHYDEQACVSADSYPHVEAALAALQARGQHAYIVTNKRTAPTARIVQAKGWQPWLRAVYCLDHGDRKFADKTATIAGLLSDYDIDPAKAVYIGDRDEDEHAATANRIPFLAAAWGYGDFGAASPHPVLADMQALLAHTAPER